MSASSAEREDAQLLAALAGRSIPLSTELVEALSARARAHHVEGPWLASVERLALVPLAVRERLESARLASAARNTWLLAAARALSGALDDARVEHRVVKGVALLRWLAHPGDRWLDDVDVLVREVDRARALEAARHAGASHRAFVMHDGRPSRAERDGTSAELEDADGASLDLHFTARPLPVADPTAGIPAPTPGGLAAGLSEHVLVHHLLSPRFAARHITDLRALLDAGHLSELLDASGTSPALARSLAWMAHLGAPELAGRIEPRAVAFGGAPLDRGLAAARRLCVLGRSGQLGWMLVPHRRYLEANDPLAAPSARLLTLHARRWSRIARSLAPSSASA